jgi:hypothetical protein
VQPAVKKCVYTVRPGTHLSYTQCTFFLLATTKTTARDAPRSPRLQPPPGLPHLQPPPRSPASRSYVAASSAGRRGGGSAPASGSSPARLWEPAGELARPPLGAPPPPRLREGEKEGRPRGARPHASGSSPARLWEPAGELARPPLGAPPPPRLRGGEEEGRRRGACPPASGEIAVAASQELRRHLIYGELRPATDFLILAGDGIIIGRTRWCAGEKNF